MCAWPHAVTRLLLWGHLEWDWSRVTVMAMAAPRQGCRRLGGGTGALQRQLLPEEPGQQGLHLQATLPGRWVPAWGDGGWHGLPLTPRVA